MESDGDGEGGLTEQERAVRASALEEALRKDEEEKGIRIMIRSRSMRVSRNAE